MRRWYDVVTAYYSVVQYQMIPCGIVCAGCDVHFARWTPSHSFTHVYIDEYVYVYMCIYIYIYIYICRYKQCNDYDMYCITT